MGEEDDIQLPKFRPGYGLYPLPWNGQYLAKLDELKAGGASEEIYRRLKDDALKPFGRRIPKAEFPPPAPCRAVVESRTASSEVEFHPQIGVGTPAVANPRYVEYVAKLEELRARGDISEKTYLRLKDEYWKRIEEDSG